MAGYIKKHLTIISTTIIILIIIGILLLTWGAKTQTKISSNVLRLHIIANSDNEVDQSVKLLIRNRILNDCAYLFKNATDADVAARLVKSSTGRITVIAQSELHRYGILYPVSAKIEKSAFPTKSYGGVRLPAGEYLALKVTLGSGAGHNWWCVLYPPLCIIDGTINADPETLSRLKGKLSAEEYALITNPDKINIKMKFRVLEFLGKYFL